MVLEERIYGFEREEEMDERFGGGGGVGDGEKKKEREKLDFDCVW
jgi:hypothetical protein